MSTPPVVQSDTPDAAAAVAVCSDAGDGSATNNQSAASKPVVSQRVRELPPPPVADGGGDCPDFRGHHAQHGRDNRPVPFSAQGDSPVFADTKTGTVSKSRRAGFLRRWGRGGGRHPAFSAGVSFVVHFVALLVAALIVAKTPSARGLGGLVLDGGEDEYLLDEQEILVDQVAAKHRADADRLSADGSESGADRQSAESPAAEAAAIDAAVASALSGSAEQQPPSPTAVVPTVSLIGSGVGIGQSPNWLASAEVAAGGGLEGRKASARARLAASRGGNERSEAAVERGLRWLRAHQNADGSWHCDHTKGPCQGLCRNPGTDTTTTGSTALVLLAFLGAGYTHVDGEYQDAVKRGLYYLQTKALVTKHGADLQDGTLYGQGIATIALCEAYAMTGDKALRDLAQQAIQFIAYAQDVRGGGWRYSPGQPGDTTVTGWQLMALKSAQMAGLEVPSPTVALVERFLDSVQTEEGACYGYRTTDPGRATTAVGLLCRMYTGWNRYHPVLGRGIAYLHQWGPSEDNMYFNYYATQVMIQSDGPHWPAWNRQMRDFLIATQAKTSHESGSWYFPGGYGDRGGRLYNTAMAVMTLEVYYRYMPLYQKKSVESAF